MESGGTIPVSLGRLRLNTPPPIMTPWFVPPVQPDPFRVENCPVRDLGTCSCMINPSLLRSQSRKTVVQLTQEEDQAVTNLLNLHYQGDGSSVPQPGREQAPVMCRGFCDCLATDCWESEEEFEIPDDLIFSPSGMNEDSGTEVRLPGELFPPLVGDRDNSATDSPPHVCVGPGGNKSGGCGSGSPFGEFLEQRVRMLSERERDAVQVLVTFSQRLQ